MTKDTLEKGTQLLQEISVAEEVLKHVECKDGLYQITIQSNNTSRSSIITNQEDLCNIAAFLTGYFKSRKSELENDFDSL